MTPEAARVQPSEQTFLEFMGKTRGFDRTIALGWASRTPSRWDHTGGTPEEGDLYTWKRGTENEQKYIFPWQTDRLWAYMFAVYQHRGGEGRYQEPPEALQDDEDDE